MRLSRPQLKMLIKSLILSEAPLGDIYVPSEKERQKFVKKLKSTELGPDVTRGTYSGYRIANDLKRSSKEYDDPLSREEYKSLKGKDESISDTYREIILKTSNVTRAANQFSKVPFNIHFMIIPQIVSEMAFGNAEGEPSEGATPFFMSDGSAHNVTTKYVEQKGARFAVLKDAPKMKKLINDIFKEKNGSLPGNNDLIIVNFLNYRWAPSSDDLMLRYQDIEEIKNLIQKKFYFLDSLYMIIHTFFDAGLFQKFTSMNRKGEYDSYNQGFNHGPPDDSRKDLMKLIFILSKYNKTILALLSNDLNLILYGDDEWKKQEIDSVEKNLGISQSEFDFYDKHLRQDVKNNIKTYAGSSPKDIADYKPDTSGIVRYTDNADILNVFRVKSIRTGKINTIFDFLSELCTVACLNRFFPIDVEKIKNLDIEEKDKEALLSLIPGCKKYIRAAIDAFDSLSGQIVIGSSTDQRYRI